MKNVLVAFLLLVNSLALGQSYQDYHQEILLIEDLIAKEQFDSALYRYEALFASYDFIFLRDGKNALQLSGYLNQPATSNQLFEKSIKNGLTRKAIRKNKWLSKAYKRSAISKELYRKWHNVFQAKINNEIGVTLKSLYNKNQWKAVGALFRLSDKAQDRYAEAKFLPMSIRHIRKLHHIIDSVGYPAEQLVGNDYWATSMISHHNSISQRFVSEDQLYGNLISPYLSTELNAGRISPYEIAEMEDWKNAVVSGHATSQYGYLGEFTAADIERINQNRAYLGLRSLALRNQLVSIEKSFGFDFSLPGKGWHKGEITPRYNKKTARSSK